MGAFPCPAQPADRRDPEPNSSPPRRAAQDHPRQLI
jgi:hypothetical protein